ncbi:MAG: transcriptional regulator [Pirellulales bacterium]|nr:transcriptional regulator [Pirellulales bacterium]
MAIELDSVGDSRSAKPKAPKLLGAGQRADADRRLRQNERLARVLRVLQLVQGRGRWTASDLAAELACSERTIYRDLQVLEVAGIPWYFDDLEACYRVRPGWQFPVLNPTAEEVVGQATAGLVAAAPGLRINAGGKPITRKLAATSSAEVGRLINDAEQLLAVLDLKLADHSRHQEIVQTVQWALLERKQLRGLYASPYKTKPLALTLHPYRLCLAQQAWYLIAREHGLSAPHIYRVARFASLAKLDASAEKVEGFDLQAYLGNAWGVFRGGATYDVEVLVTPEAAPLIIETRWHSTQRAKKHADGSVTLSFRVDGLDEILWWYLGWAGRARVVKPVELRRMVQEQLGAALELNGEGQSVAASSAHGSSRRRIRPR